MAALPYALVLRVLTLGYRPYAGKPHGMGARGHPLPRAQNQQKMTPKKMTPKKIQGNSPIDYRGKSFVSNECPNRCK